MEFKIGQEYIRPGLFGPSFWVRCMERTEDTATFAQVGYEDDPDWTTIKIERDGDTETCECYEYMGTTDTSEQTVDSEQEARGNPGRQ